MKMGACGFLSSTGGPRAGRLRAHWRARRFLAAEGREIGEVVRVEASPCLVLLMRVRVSHSVLPPSLLATMAVTPPVVVALTAIQAAVAMHAGHMATSWTLVAEP